MYVLLCACVCLYDNFLKAELFDPARTFETLVETARLSSEKVVQVHTPANSV